MKKERHWENELAAKQIEIDGLNLANEQLLHRLDTIEDRLAGLEKNFISVPEIE